MIHMLILSLLLVSQPYDAQTQKALSRIGTWDGTTQAAELKGPYEDRLQQEVRFGQGSFYLAPWRSYMDTQPASQFLNVMGVNFTANDREADAVCQLLDEAGIHGARTEIGWGSIAYDDESTIQRQKTHTRNQGHAKIWHPPARAAQCQFGLALPGS